MKDLQRMAKRMVGQRVWVRHTNGKVYHGILHSVTDQGVYLRPVGFDHVKAEPINETAFMQAIGQKKEEGSVEPVFWWAWWLILWALIAGFWWWGGGGWGRWGYGRGAYGYGYGGYGPYAGAGRGYFW